jgi:hypothetical protein
MATSRIQMEQSHGKTPPNVYADFDWIHVHEHELLAEYGECSVIVYQQQVIGVGHTYAAALEDAERRLPPDSPTITPVHQWLGARYRVSRDAKCIYK